MESGRDCSDLVTDGALRIERTPDLAPLIEGWLPERLPVAPASHPDPARIRIVRSTERPDTGGEPKEDPIIRLGNVLGRWSRSARTGLELRGRSGTSGALNLDDRTATLRVSPDRRLECAESDLHSMLTLSAGILLSRMRRALIHAAAVVGPDGRARLLVGDTHAGKTTTAVNLIRAGWDFISDDQVILSERGLRVEGWLRSFHLDAAWGAAEDPGQPRVDLDPRRIGPGRHRSRAPVGSLLFPEIRPEHPTELRALEGGDALSLLIRQTPWFFLDHAAAPDVLTLLTAAVDLPTYSLRLGMDTFRDGERLLEILSGTDSGSGG